MKHLILISLVMLTVVTASVSAEVTKQFAPKTKNSQSLQQTTNGDLFYYVAIDGNDQNPGTIKAPKRSTLSQIILDKNDLSI